MLPGIEEALIGAGAVIVAACGAVYGVRVAFRATVKATITTVMLASNDIQKQIEAGRLTYASSLPQTGSTGYGRSAPPPTPTPSHASGTPRRSVAFNSSPPGLARSPAVARLALEPNAKP